MSWFLDSLIPDDWRSAKHSLREMTAAVSVTSGAKAKALVGFGAPFVVGLVGSLFFVPQLVALDSVKHADFVSGLCGGMVALGTLLSGFMVTLMLFTGRIEASARVSYEVLAEYVAKLKYLLASQAGTLFASLIMTALAIAWYVAWGLNVNPASLELLGVFFAGFAMVAFVRTALLPMQIYEVHEAALDDLVEEKRRETNQMYKKEE